MSGRNVRHGQSVQSGSHDLAHESRFLCFLRHSAAHPKGFRRVHFRKGASRVICEASSATPCRRGEAFVNAASLPRSFTRMLRPCWRVSSPLAEGEAFVNELWFVISPSRMLRPYPRLPPLFRNTPFSPTGERIHILGALCRAPMPLTTPCAQ